MNVECMFHRMFVILFVYFISVLIRKIKLTLKFSVCQILCRCNFRTYREWISIHHISIPLTDNNNLNKRWGIRIHPFYK